MSSRFGNCNQACERAAPAIMMTHPSVSSGWTAGCVAVVKSHDCLHSVKIQPGGLFGAVGRDGMDGGLGVHFSPDTQAAAAAAAAAQASMGLDTMLFGVSGS